MAGVCVWDNGTEREGKESVCRREGEKAERSRWGV